MTDHAALALPDSFLENLPASIPTSLKYFQWGGGSLAEAKSIALYEIIRTVMEDGTEKAKAVKINIDVLSRNIMPQPGGIGLRQYRHQDHEALWFEESILDHLEGFRQD
jgi:hypothetical protein